MRLRVQWTALEVLPSPECLHRAMGLPEGVPPSARTASLEEEARSTFLRLAAPCAVVEVVDAATFARVYAGGHGNDRRTPLADIYPRADVLALFVATIGAPLTDAIGDLFARRRPAHGYVLDTLASEAADALALRLGDELATRARDGGWAGPGARGLPYSPGYCGWHVSGQRALFEALEPARDIGVTLNDSSLMQPLKSVSGVVAVASPGVHGILTDYECCEACATRECQNRLMALRHT